MLYEEFVQDNWKNATVDNYFKMSPEERKKVTRDDAYVMVEVYEEVHGNVFDEMGGHEFFGMGEEGFERLDIIEEWWASMFREPFPEAEDRKKVLD